MTQYVFVLGSNWLLSIAELLSYVGDRGMPATLVDHSRNVAILEIDRELETESIIELQSSLGGCFKIGKVLHRHERESAAKAYPSEGKTEQGARRSLADVRWAKRIWPYAKGKRVRFGVSTYPVVSGRKEGVNYRKFTRKMNEQLKNWLAKNGTKRADYFSYDEPDRRVPGRLNVALWPKTIQKNNLLTPPNAEVIAAFTSRRLYIAKTLVVYDSLLQQYRDESRPFVSAEISTSPKVCRTLLNLAGARPGETVLDPFCGTGTILMEAALLGMKCIGVDKDRNQVQGAKSNLKWLAQDLGQKLAYSIVVGDARNLSSLMSGQVDAVAFEPALGEVYKQKPERPRALEEIRSLTELYRDALTEIAKLLRSDGRVAMTLPVINTQSGQLSINVRDMLRDTGLSVYPLLPADMIRSEASVDQNVRIRPQREQLPERKRGQIVQRWA